MSNIKKTVDVIIPNFNKGNFICEAIESVINQTYKNWELLIINNNSKDKTYEVIKSFKDKRTTKDYFIR